MSLEQLSLEEFNIEDFDFDLFTDLSPEPSIENSRCEFKECIQTKVNDPFFCDYHSNLVHKVCKVDRSSPKSKKRKKYGDKCAVKNCRGIQAPRNYLCDFHCLELDELEIIYQFHCKKRGCHKVRHYKQAMCIKHSD